MVFDASQQMCNTDTPIHIHTYTHTHTHACIQINMHTFVAHRSMSTFSPSGEKKWKSHSNWNCLLQMQCKPSCDFQIQNAPTQPQHDGLSMTHWTTAKQEICPIILTQWRSGNKQVSHSLPSSPNFQIQSGGFYFYTGFSRAVKFSIIKITVSPEKVIPEYDSAFSNNNAQLHTHTHARTRTHIHAYTQTQT